MQQLVADNTLLGILPPELLDVVSHYLTWVPAPQPMTRLVQDNAARFIASVEKLRPQMADSPWTIVDFWWEPVKVKIPPHHRVITWRCGVCSRCLELKPNHELIQKKHLGSQLMFTCKDLCKPCLSGPA